LKIGDELVHILDVRIGHRYIVRTPELNKTCLMNLAVLNVFKINESKLQRWDHGKAE
jgi:hypothetical protein